MIGDVKALIEEARAAAITHRAALEEAGIRRDGTQLDALLDRLAGALEAFQAPKPDESEREVLRSIISETESLQDDEGTWALPEDVADAILDAGFHRIPSVEDIAKIVASRRGVTARVNDTDREVARAVIARIEASAS